LELDACKNYPEIMHPLFRVRISIACCISVNEQYACFPTKDFKDAILLWDVGVLKMGSWNSVIPCGRRVSAEIKTIAKVTRSLYTKE